MWNRFNYVTAMICHVSESDDAFHTNVLCDLSGFKIRFRFARRDSMAGYFFLMRPVASRWIMIGKLSYFSKAVAETNFSLAITIFVCRIYIVGVDVSAAPRLFNYFLCLFWCLFSCEGVLAEVPAPAPKPDRCPLALSGSAGARHSVRPVRWPDSGGLKEHSRSQHREICAAGLLSCSASSTLSSCG